MNMSGSLNAEDSIRIQNVNTSRASRKIDASVFDEYDEF